MKNFTRIVAVMFALLISGFTFAQDYVEVGTGTSTTNRIPFYGYYGYNWSAEILEQAAIGLNSPVLITGIAYNVSNTPANYSTPTQKIYLTHTSQTQWGDANYDDPSGYDLVWEGDVTWDGSGWHQINFDQAFLYDGSNNLVVQYEDWNGAWGSGYPYWYYTSTTYHGKYKYQDGSFPAVSGYRGSYMTNVRLYYQELEPGSLSGTITDGMTGDPVNGAKVTVGNSYTFTMPDGTYSFDEVSYGNYDVTVEKAGYATGMQPVFIGSGMAVTADITIIEDMPSPVGVYAEVLPSNVVDISWGAPGTSYEIIYDDGTAENFAVWSQGGNMNALKFMPPGYPCEIVAGSVYVGDGTYPMGNDILQPFFMAIYDDNGTDGMPGTELARVEVVPVGFGWVAFDFGADAQTIEDGQFYLAMVQGGNYPECLAVGVDESDPSFRSYQRFVTGGQGWTISGFNDFMIRAICVGPAGVANLGYEPGFVEPARISRGHLFMNAPEMISGFEGMPIYKATSDEPINNRAFNNYTVWRLGYDEVNMPEEWELLGNTTNLNYRDNAWPSLPEGGYRWAVAANYSAGQSEVGISNILGNNWEAEVTINVSLSSGELPTNAYVMLVNDDGLAAHVYEGLVDETGTIVFPEVWKGDYTLSVTKFGYDPYTSAEAIYGDATIDVELQEVLNPPLGLHVNPVTLLATWLPPGVDLDLFTEDFESSFATNEWTFDPSQGNWQISTPGNPGNSAEFYWSPSITNYQHSLVSKTFSGLGFPNMFLSFDLYLSNFSTSTLEEMIVEVYDGAAWTVVENFSNAGGSISWGNHVYDISAFAVGNEFQIRFRAQGADSYNINNWNIDNVMLYGEVPEGNRAVNGYAFYLDDEIMTAYVTETQYQIQPWMVSWGQTYTSSVAAVYNNGYSEKSYYTWTAQYLPPPRDLEGMANGHYAELMWSPPMIEYPRAAEVTVLSQQARENTDATVDASPVQRNVQVTGGTRDMWDLQLNFPCGDGSGEAGAETDGVKIYTTKWNGSASAGTFFSYELDGTFNGDFTISGCGNIRDLAFDGTYMYGADATSKIWQMDFNNQSLVSTLVCPTAVRAIAYDDDQDAFYVNNWSTNITLVDRSGNVINSWPIGAFGSFYGMAYDAFQPGADPMVWGFSQDGSGGVLVQHDAATGAATGVTYDVVSELGVAGDLAGGIYTTTDLVSGTVSLGGIIQNNLLFAYELYPYAGGGGTGTYVAPSAYNIYKDGVFYDQVDSLTLEFTSEYLIAGWHQFTVTALYGEPTPGESGPALPGPADIYILGEGTLTGTVSVCGTIPTPIEGAMITAVNPDTEETFIAYSGPNGVYSMNVTEATYNITCEAEDFVTQMVEGIFVPDETTVEVDFNPCEFPYPVIGVTAERNYEHTECFVDWYAPMFFETIAYDDGMADDVTAWDYAGNMNAVKFTPAGYPCEVMGGAVNIYDGSWPSGNTLAPFQIAILDDNGVDGMPGQVLATMDVMPGSNGWVDAILDEPVVINDGEFYIAMIQGGDYPDCAPIAIDNSSTEPRSYSRYVTNNEPWRNSDFTNFMMRAYVYNEADNRELEKYEVYRLLQGQEELPETWSLLANDLTVTEYNDYDWDQLEQGWYRYAVKAVYTYNVSEPVFSNVVPRGYDSEVTVNVRDEDGMGVGDALVVLTSMTDPDMYTFSATTPASGSVYFHEVWNGMYKLSVYKDGYTTYDLANIYIADNTTLNVILQSLCLPPQNFQVNAQTGVATWLPPVVEYETVFEEGFEGGVIPPGWTQQYLVQNVSWGIGNGGPTGTPPNAHSGQYNATFMGSSATTKLITPAIDLAGALVPKLSFWHTQKAGAGQDELRVYYRTSATGSWVALASYIANIEVWQNETISLPNPSGSYYLAFEAQGPEPAGMGIALDDVKVMKGVAPGADSRALLGFNLYLDGQYVDYTTDYTYTYTGLEIEQTYIAGITAEYTSCTSVMVNYAFTYMPCYLFNPPTNFNGVANPGNQVALTWDLPEGADDREATVIGEEVRTNVPANAEGSPMVREIEVSGNRDMWDLQFNFACGDASGEAGAETDGAKFYTTKWNGSASLGTFFSYEMDGTFNGSFEISGCGNVRDLAYDGEYFYGADATAKIWQMDFDAQTLVSTLTAPAAVRAIAYDDDQDAFYINNWSETVQLVDRSGAVINSWPVGSYGSYYGMAYDNFDPEAEPSVWCFSQDGSGGVLVQNNAETGAWTGMMWDAVAALATSGTDLGGGLFTHENIVAGTVTLGGIIQNISVFGYELYGAGGGGGGSDFVGFNVYRDGLKLTPAPISALGFNETITPGGEYTYNVTAVYEPNFESCPEEAEVTLCVGCDLDEPQCILAEVQESDVDVLVAWCTPGAVSPEYWISYFTDLTHLSWAAPERATLYNVTDFGAEYPVEVTQLSHMFYEHPSYPWGADLTFKFKVYAADGTTVLYESADVAALQYPDETIVVLTDAIVAEGDFYLAIAANPETGMPSSAAIEDLTNSHGYVGEAGAWEAYELEWASRVKIRTAADEVMLQPNTSGHAVNVATDVATIDEPVEVRDLNRAILLGYNVWRNGDVITYVPAPDTFYMDMNLAPGDYAYCVTAIYDEGESTPICAEPVTVEAKGMIAGTIYDGTDGTVLNGVTVTVGEMTTTTGYDGYYEMVVPSGMVDVMAELAGYATKVKTAQVFYDQTTVVDFNLYPEGVVFTVPFEEPWDGGFEEQNWTFDAEMGNWDINDAVGLPAPSAEFNWSPTQEEYSYALVSPQIDGEGVSNIALSFDLYLSDYSSNGLEHLTVEVFNGMEWMEVADFANTGDIEWENYLFDISEYALNELFQVRFVANGTNSFDINYWYVDNVMIYERLLANVYGQVTVCATGDPVEGAMITVGDYEPVYTDAGGYYSVSVEHGTYDVACEMDGYNVVTATAVEITEDLEWNVCLTQPTMDVTPLEIYVDVIENSVHDEYVTVANNGDGSLGWNASINWVAEDVVVPAINPDYPRLNVPVSINFAPASLNLNGYVEEPVELLRGSMAYAFDAYPGTYGFHQLDTDAPGDPIVVNPVPNWSAFAGDFDANGNLYIIDADDSNLKMVDILTGEGTVVGYASAMGGQSWTGMACNKATGVMYAVSTDVSESYLYTINLTTGAATVIGATGVEGIIDIACDGAGAIYANCIVNDAIFQLDPATGASTYIGLTGYDANYAQGMAWDPATDQIFLAAYGSSGELRLLDKYTGATSLIGGFAGGAEVTVFAFPGRGETWLTVEHNGTVAAGMSEDVLFHFDATGYEVDEVKVADVVFTSNPDVGSATVHVEMTVVIGIEEFAGVDVNLYPNPAKQYVNIELSEQVQSFRILNTVGQTVYEQASAETFFQVDVQSYDAGAYLIEFTTNDGVTFNKRFVVTK